MKQLLLFILLSFTALSCSKNLNGKMVNDLNDKGVIAAGGKSISIPGYTKGDAAIFYLVRHAEKEGGKDPSLTDDGMIRAKKLGKMLEDVKLSTIFSTNYKRTIYTAAPTAELQKMEVDSYNPKKQSEFLDPLLSRQGEKFLIVGHSNSIPNLLNLFQSKKVYDHIDESVYDNLFIVLYKSEEDCKIIELKY